MVSAAGLEMPVRQRDVGGEELIRRADYLDQERNLVIEVDSRLHHSFVIDREADLRRDRALGAAGYRVVRVTEEQLWHRPHEVVDAVKAA